MKAITAIFNVSVEEVVLERIKACGVKSFTLLPRIMGQGPGTEPRLGSHVWPGVNAALVMVMDADLARKVMECLREYSETPEGRLAGIFAYQVAVEAVVSH